MKPDRTERHLGRHAGRRLEDFLARLYSDPDALARFRLDPSSELQKAGLAEAVDVDRIDWTGLELAAASFARKRARE